MSFSPKTLRELGNVLSDFSTLGPIGHLFDDARIGIADDDVAARLEATTSGQRRTLVAQRVAALNLRRSDDVRKLLTVFDDVLADVIPHDDEFGSPARTRLLRLLEADGFIVAAGGRLREVTARRVDLVLEDVDHVEVVQEHLDRIDREVDTDPAGAISAVKALLESTGKIVIRQTGGKVSAKASVPAILAEAQKRLGLMAGTLAPDKAGDESLKKILDGLYKVAVGIVELRNRYGRDHGRDAPLRGLTERHARLAVHSGTAYCRFLLDTLADADAPWRRTPGGAGVVPDPRAQ